MKIGRSADYKKNYLDEVEFSRRHKFDFMQVWYDKNGLGLYKNDEPRHVLLKDCNFPIIIHALLDINEFEEHIPILKNILNYLGHKELIIHPVCKSEKITEESIRKLCEKVKFALDILRAEGVTVYLENNSKLDPIFTHTEEINFIFSQIHDLEFLMDIAHIDSYKHLKQMVSIKKPKILHIADKHFNIIHEHLPVGDGEIDFNYIFQEVLSDFNGKVILEIIQSESAILNSREMILKSFG